MDNTLILKLIEMLVDNKTEKTSINNYPIGQKIILRGVDSGVLYGELVSVNNGVYRLKNARRLWYWKSKKGIALEDVAVHGLLPDSKLTSSIPLCDNSDPKISMILPCSEVAIASIESIPVFEP